MHCKNELTNELQELDSQHEIALAKVIQVKDELAERNKILQNEIESLQNELKYQCKTTSIAVNKEKDLIEQDRLEVDGASKEIAQKGIVCKVDAASQTETCSFDQIEQLNSNEYVKSNLIQSEQSLQQAENLISLQLKSLGVNCEQSSLDDKVRSLLDSFNERIKLYEKNIDLLNINLQESSLLAYELDQLKTCNIQLKERVDCLQLDNCDLMEQLQNMKFADNGPCVNSGDIDFTREEPEGATVDTIAHYNAECKHKLNEIACQTTEFDQHLNCLLKYGDIKSQYDDVVKEKNKAVVSFAYSWFQMLLLIRFVLIIGSTPMP